MQNRFILILLALAVWVQDGVSGTPVVDSLLNLGHQANRRANYETALRYYLMARQEADSLKNAGYKASTTFLIADIYRATLKRPESLRFIRENMPQNPGPDEIEPVCKLLNLIASVHYEEFISNPTFGLDSALFYASRATSYIREKQDKKALGQNYMILGAIYANLLQYDQALDYLRQAEELYLETGRTDDIPNILNNITTVYMNQSQYEEGIEVAKRSLEMATVSGVKIYQMVASANLVQLFERQGKYREAFNYLKMYKDLQKAILDENMMAQVSQLREQYESEKTETENKALRAELHSQNLFFYSAVTVFSLGLIVILVLLVAYREKSKAERKLKEQKLEIERYNELMFTLNVEIAQANESSKEKARLLDETNRVKDRLFSLISHDLRGPVAALQSSLSLVADNSFRPEEQAGLIEELRIQVQSTADLLNNLLYWSSGQMQGLKRSPEPVSINELLQENGLLFKTQAHRKGIHLTLSYPEFPLTSETDRTMMNLAIRNLTSNAMKFTSSGGSVTLSAEKRESGILIRVADTGSGMNQDQISRLFLNEAPASTPGTQNERGLGLGLMMVKQFVELNGGTLSVASEPGHGTSFSILLPAAEG